MTQICATCGTQFAPSDEAQRSCPICRDERPVHWATGQESLDELRKTHRDVFLEEGWSLWGIHTEPELRIGQGRWSYKDVKGGGILSECVSLIDATTVGLVLVRVPARRRAGACDAAKEQAGATGCDREARSNQTHEHMAHSLAEDCQGSGLAGLAVPRSAQHAITELAESLARDQTIMAIAGHVPPKTLAHYSHVRLEAEWAALDALSGGVSGGVMSQSATQISTPIPQVSENDGGADETRTRDLLRDRQAF